MPPRLPDTLTRELGSPGLVASGGILETFEETPDLRWPANMVVYDRMRRDGQIAGILRAITLPIRRTGWHLAGSDVDARVMAFVEDELGLNLAEEGRRRRRREGISWDDYVRHALLKVPFGHMVFEQVYNVGPPAPDAPEGLPPLVAHLRKLGPRLPRTISGWDVADDGGLEYVRQVVPRRVSDAPGAVLLDAEVRIPVDRLVVHVQDQEGSDWTGNSVLRGAYKHWLIKDLLLRLGPMAVERNGMGLPVVSYSAGGDRSKALEIASSARMGEKAGVALEDGKYRLELLGVTGSVRDELPLIKYHDEAAGRSALAMFLNLGHDNGARSLGDTFVDYFVLSLGAIIAELEEVTTEHVIRDLVALNFGQDEPYPELKADEVTADAPLTAEALKQLVEAGLLTPDEELEVELRRRHGLPSMGTPRPELPGPEAVTDVPQGDGVEPVTGDRPAPGPPIAPRNAPPGGPPSNPDVYPDGYPLRHPTGASEATLDELMARLEVAQARLAAARAARAPA